MAIQILPPHARHCMVIRNAYTCAYIAKRILRYPFCFVYTSCPLAFHACPLPFIQDMSLSSFASLLSFFSAPFHSAKLRGGEKLLLSLYHASSLVVSCFRRYSAANFILYPPISTYFCIKTPFPLAYVAKK